jgi:hypothetical protein
LTKTGSGKTWENSRKEMRFHAGYFHADLKPENLLLHWPASDSGGGGGGGEAEAAFELKVCDWEGDNWPVTAAEIGPARCRLRDNLMLARCAAALYADLHVFSTSENLAARYGKRLFAPFLY